MFHHHHLFTRTNKRDNNEDACLAYTLNIPNATENQRLDILLLSDGMGGHEHGEVISRFSIATMAQQINSAVLAPFILPKESPNTVLDTALLDYKAILETAIRQTNADVLQLMKDKKWSQAGATLVAVIVCGQHYTYGYLGDSRLYQWHQAEDQLERVTNDHNVPGILVQEGVITEEVAKYHAQKNQLVYFIGVDKVPKLEKVAFIGEGELSSGDALLLCSDGINGSIEGAIAPYFQRHHADASAYTASFLAGLADAGMKKGEKDNQTAVLFHYDTPHEQVALPTPQAATETIAEPVAHSDGPPSPSDEYEATDEPEQETGKPLEPKAVESADTEEAPPAAEDLTEPGEEPEEAPPHLSAEPDDTPKKKNSLAIFLRWLRSFFQFRKKTK